MVNNDLISAKQIKYSMSEDGVKLMTLELTAPKFIDAEFEKHRMISSNSSSSRAIPFKRTLDRDVFVPTDVRYNEKGMQGYKKVDDIDKTYFTALSEEMYDNSVAVCKTMDKELDIHKQHINRFLEPWTIQRKVATANIQWFEYFLELREAPNADPNIQDLARKMRIEMEKQPPEHLENGEWHIPYLSEIEEENMNIKEKLYHSVARCARVSYDNFEGELSNIEQDKNLYDFLIEAKHATPFEHQAKAIMAKVDTGISIYDSFRGLPPGVTTIARDGEIMSGNFNGFIQYRQMA